MRERNRVRNTHFPVWRLPWQACTEQHWEFLSVCSRSGGTNYKVMILLLPDWEWWEELKFHRTARKEQRNKATWQTRAFWARAFYSHLRDVQAAWNNFITSLFVFFHNCFVMNHYQNICIWESDTLLILHHLVLFCEKSHLCERDSWRNDDILHIFVKEHTSGHEEILHNFPRNFN